MARIKRNPGVYYNVPFSEYLEIDAVNHSALKMADRSMAHVHWCLEGASREPTDAMQLGTALHAWLLERDRYAELVAVKPEFTGEGAKKRRAEWMEANNGKAIISETGEESVKAMGIAVSRHKAARKLAAAPGKREVVLVWMDAPTGVMCKARADKVIEPNLIVDIKTTEKAAPWAFRASIGRYSYHTGIAFYERGAKALGLHDDIVGCLLAVESDDPHGVAVYELDGPSKNEGHNKVEAWLRMVAQAQTTGAWPGYSDEVELIGLPSWAMRKPGENSDGQGYTDHDF